MAAATACFWISLYLYVPILPLHAEELGASLTVVGLVVAAYAIGQVVLRIPIGIGADILTRRKPFAIASLALSGLGALWLGLAPDPGSLFAARTLTGIAAAGWVAISVLYASYFPSGRTVSAMSGVMAINTLSILLATLCGGLLADWLGNTSTFYGGAVFGLLGAAILLPAREPAAEKSPYSVRTVFRVIRAPLLLQVSLIAITFQFVAFGTTFGFLPVYAEGIGASKAQVGYITTTVLAGGVFGALLSAVLVRRMGYRAALALGSVVLMASIVVVPLTGSLLVLGTIQVFTGLGRGVLNTILIGLSLRAAPPAERATAMGVFQAIYATGMFAGPVVSGLVADAVSVGAVFYMAAAVTAVGGALIFLRRLPAD